MSKFAPKASSAARSRLQETIAAREEVDHRLAELQGALTKLASQSDAVYSAEAALAALDNAEDFAAVKWARGEGERPAPDIEARDRLARELAAARASAASAARASDTIVAQMTQEASKAPDIQRYADAAVVEVLCETAAPLVEELRSAAIALATKIRSLEYVSGRALEIAEKGRHVPSMSQAEHDLRAIGVKGLAIQHAEPANPTPPEALAAATALLAIFSARVWEPIARMLSAATENVPLILEKDIAAIEAWKSFENDLRADPGVTVAPEVK
jgi:hypothetical protein